MQYKDTRADPLASSSWPQAVAHFADSQGLPAERLLDGMPFTCDRWIFRLQYNPHADPEGLVVMLDLGEIPQETAGLLQLEMLSENVRRPASLMGYYGIAPGTRRGAYCYHIDMRNVSPRPHQAIHAAVACMAATMESSRVMMNGVMDGPFINRASGLP
jgi:hypothetical protein